MNEKEDVKRQEVAHSEHHDTRSQDGTGSQNGTVDAITAMNQKLANPLAGMSPF